MAKNRTKYTKKTTRKPKREIFTGICLPGVAYEGGYGFEDLNRDSNITEFANSNRRNKNRFEREFEKILRSLGDGYFRKKGTYYSQYAFSGDWILDFFIPEVRLGIEIDGGIHQTKSQMVLDKQKTDDAAKFDITLIRFTNAEVFGDRSKLIEKLRRGWRLAMQRENRIIGKPHA